MRNAFRGGMRRYALAVVVSSLLSGATLERLSLDDLINQSTAIVRGRVAGSYTTSSGSLISTNFKIQVLERWKGAERSTEEVMIPGGTLGNVRQSFPGVPQLAEGTEYLLFLWTGKSGVTHVLGFTQGVFDLPKNSSGESMALRGASRETLLEPGTGRIVKDEQIEMRLRDLSGRIKSTLARGEGR
jgi:hypothetical protein